MIRTLADIQIQTLNFGFLGHVVRLQMGNLERRDLSKTEAAALAVLLIEAANSISEKP